MKLSKVKQLFSVYLCFVATLAFAQQSFQGKAIYMSKTTMDMSQFGDGRQIPPDRMKQIQERMKNFLEKEYTLVFNKEESIYKEEETLEAQGGSGRWGGFASSFAGGPKYKNVKTKEILQDNEFFGKKFLVKDALESLDWKMGTETKQIGAYTVFKATAIKEASGLDISNWRRRGNENEKKEDEIPRMIEITAWYTPQIPVNQGPDDYWGLPGLILEINADRTTILCTKIIMNPKEKDNINKPEKGEVVTQEEYTKIITKKIEEMRSNWSGRGRGRRN